MNSYFETYKRLDNLCKDILQSNIGISMYIEEMEKCSYIRNEIDDWNEIYQTLKYYRHLRNKIAHEVGVLEKDFCAEKDIQWLDNFYQKILRCEDPLALYRQLKNKKQKKIIFKSSKQNARVSVEHVSKVKKNRKRNVAIFYVLLIIMVIIIIAIILSIY